MDLVGYFDEFCISVKFRLSVKVSAFCEMLALCGVFGFLWSSVFLRWRSGWGKGDEAFCAVLVLFGVLASCGILSLLLVLILLAVLAFCSQPTIKLNLLL